MVGVIPLRIKENNRYEMENGRREKQWPRKRNKDRVGLNGWLVQAEVGARRGYHFVIFSGDSRRQ